ncbi:MAG: TAXI family TRAP transporter solute-binding subunit [Algisphaera sp.]
MPDRPTPPSSDDPPKPALAPLQRRASRHAWRRDLLKVWLPVLALAFVGFAIAWQFVEPAPPSRVRLGTGTQGGAYEAMGERLAASFARRDVFLQPVATQGSTENAAMLVAGELDAAILQGGSLDDLERPDGVALEAVVSVDYEPLFIVTRRDLLFPADPSSSRGIVSLDTPDLANVLSSQRVAVGALGSGTRPLVCRLLQEIGLSVNAETTVDLGGDQALDALIHHEVAAAFFVLSAQAPRLKQILANPDLAIIGLNQAQGLAQRTAYLAPVTLARGVVDPVHDLPGADLSTVAPVAFLAVRENTHRAVVQLLVRAAVEDQHPHLVGEPNTFPTLDRADLPIAAEARYFFNRGPNMLHRTLPFWIASTIDRLAILLIPALTLLIPLSRLAPPMIRWRVRRRIYRWYRQLRVIDDDLGRHDLDSARLMADRDQLRELDDEVSETDVPLSYMEEFYNLRLHIAYMRQRVDGRLNT